MGKEWLGGLKPLLDKVVPEIGFDYLVGEGVKVEVTTLFPFIRWRVGQDREVRRSEAVEGWSLLE